MKISLVILTKNEIEGVRSIIPKIPRQAVDEIVVIDGQSTDGTKEYLEQDGFRVIVQEKMGRGEAFRLAMERTSGDALIFFSPDGNEDPLDIPKFRTYLEQGSDMVIASRMVKEAHNEEDEQLIRLRKWVNLAFGLIANTLWNRSGRFVSDTINGYRAITKEAFGRIKPDGSGYTIEYQSSIRAFKLRLKIAEFPTNEGPRIGPGGSPAMTTGIAFIKCLLSEIQLSFSR